MHNKIDAEQNRHRHDRNNPYKKKKKKTHTKNRPQKRKRLSAINTRLLATETYFDESENNSTTSKSVLIRTTTMCDKEA